MRDKERRLRELLAAENLDALLLRRVSSFAWATAGAPSYVGTATETGEAALLYLPDRRCLVTNVIEAPRLEREHGLGEQGFQIVASPWHQAGGVVERLTAGLRVGSDGPWPGAVDLSAHLARLRAALGASELMRFRALGVDCAKALGFVADVARPGQSEQSIAAALGAALLERGIGPIVLQVASDERVRAYRHVLPTERRLERHLFLSFCGRRGGLVCSVTRTQYFGRPPADLLARQRAVAGVDATLIAATRPGAALRDVFQAAVDRYQAEGFAGEWERHHQGGAAGYEPREYLASPTSTDVIALGQVFAWNPSVAGAKSEDTVAVGEHDVEVLTEVRGWPMIEVEAAGRTFRRPALRQVT